MDPGALALITLLAPAVGSFAAGATVIAGGVAGIHGHQRGDYSGAIHTAIWGSLITGMIYTAPKWVPALIAAVSGVTI